MILSVIHSVSKTKSEYSPEDARALPPSLDQAMPVEMRHQVAFQLEHCPGTNFESSDGTLCFFVKKTSLCLLTISPLPD